MTLTDKEKERIKEEELYRKSIRKDLAKKHSSKSIEFWMVIFIVVGIIGVIIYSVSKFPKTTDPKTSNNLSATPTLTQEELDKKIQTLADTFCLKRASGEHINLDEFSKFLESEGPMTLHNSSKPAIKESCKKIAKLCLDYWSEDDCQKIAEEKIWIGMEANQLLLSWGSSYDQNNTTGSWGIHTQWVYGDFGPYVYLEGKDKNNLTVTSFQN